VRPSPGKVFKGIVDLKIRNRRGAYFSNKLPLFVEHPHVYTLGKSGDLSNLLLSEKQLEEKVLRSTKLIAVEILHTMDQVKL
jgi:lipoate-protein ligase B